MTDESSPVASTDAATQPLLKVRLPGFVRDEEIGLGDVLRKASYASRDPAVRRMRRPRGDIEPLGKVHPLNTAQPT
ncbi:MAG TPA: hypothetical protein VKI44_25635 [Acetobacteraceae bacterium]|nr:hypothetical protein [Acetobacteraceae bacterium]